MVTANSLGISLQKRADGDDVMCQLGCHHGLYKDIGGHVQLVSLRGMTLLCTCNRVVCHGVVLVAVCLAAQVVLAIRRRQSSERDGK